MSARSWDGGDSARSLSVGQPAEFAQKQSDKVNDDQYRQKGGREPSGWVAVIIGHALEFYILAWRNGRTAMHEIATLAYPGSTPGSASRCGRFGGMIESGDLISRLWQAQDGCCFHCNEKMIRSGAHDVLARHVPGRLVSRDHLFPRSTSGRGMLNNLVLAHCSCNGARGNNDPTPEMVERARALYAQIGEEPFLTFGSVPVDRVFSDVALATIVKRRTAPLMTIADLLTPADKARLDAIRGGMRELGEPA